jgi:hypothetical protein
MAKWKASVNVPGVDDPHGFHRCQGRRWADCFVYPTQKACESAAKHIGLALEEVVSNLRLLVPQRWWRRVADLWACPFGS